MKFLVSLKDLLECGLFRNNFFFDGLPIKRIESRYLNSLVGAVKAAVLPRVAARTRAAESFMVFFCFVDSSYL